MGGAYCAAAAGDRTGFGRRADHRRRASRGPLAPAGCRYRPQQRTAGLPAQARDKLISGFQTAARSGLEVGSGHKLTGLGGQIFSHGFVDAMRPTMLTPIVILLVGAASCLLIVRRPATAADQPPGGPAGVAEEATALG
jgi:hypothetical protein